LTICFPESDGAANHTSGNKNNQQFPPLTSKIPDSSRYGGGIRSKLNVLAVCAVFVFVGAILLGAF
jgi:hypothetical protein